VGNALHVPESGDDWVGLTDQLLPTLEALDWSILPGCGAEVLFAGTVRDHAEGRDGVTELQYEAYEEAGLQRLSAIAAEARRRWEDLGRIALLHRLGRLQLGEISVVVVVSAPHRGAAFEAAKWCIDTLKSTVPIWKRETWEGGADWGTEASDIATIEEGRVSS
jgi:molybdopterin synthase catalytic subunit